MKMEYYAHIDEYRTQTVKEHLEAVSQRCGEFSNAFCAKEQGEWIGLAHDIGKCSIEFQKRLKGGPRVDHATAGAYECKKAEALWAAGCVAGHHSGLADFGNFRDIAGDATLWGRLNNAKAGNIPQYELPVTLLPAPPTPPCGADALSWSFYIRMLYSCLVDADFLDTEAFMSAGKVKRGGGDSLETLLDRLKEKKINPWMEQTRHHNPSLSKQQNDILRKRCDILLNA